MWRVGPWGLRGDPRTKMERDHGFRPSHHRHWLTACGCSLGQGTLPDRRNRICKSPCRWLAHHAIPQGLESTWRLARWELWMECRISSRAYPALFPRLALKPRVLAGRQGDKTFRMVAVELMESNYYGIMVLLRSTFNMIASPAPLPSYLLPRSMPAVP